MPAAFAGRLRFGAALASMPNSAAMCGTRDATLAIAAFSSSVGSAGTAAGVTAVRTGENASASMTIAQRSWEVSSVRFSRVASVSFVVISAGTGAPALGGRELRRRARTTRPSARVWLSSPSQEVCSSSTRLASPSRSC